MARMRPLQLMLACLLALGGLAAIAPVRVAQAAQTVITDCSDHNAIEAQLEAGGDFLFNCGVVTITFDSTITLGPALSIDGAGTTTFSGGGTIRLFDTVTAGANLKLSRLTIVDGYASLDDSPSGTGGAIFVVYATLTITDCTFSSNEAWVGGAIAAFRSDVTITGSTFTDNRLYPNPGDLSYGGAIYNFAPWGSAYRMSIDSSVLSWNGGLNSLGGAIQNEGTLRITNSTLSDNTAASGGAINNGSNASTAALTLVGSTLSGNLATSNGGGIFVHDGPVGIADSTFSGNLSRGDGSAIGNGWASLDPSMAGGTTTITSSTFVNNTSDEDISVPTLSHDTTASTTVRNSIVAVTLGDTGCLGAITSGGHNIVNDASCAFAATGDQNSTFLFLTALQDNGGPTLTHEPFAGSAATDSGACPGETADQRGISRPQGAACDVGAVEDDTPSPNTRFTAPRPAFTGATVTFAFASSEVGSTFECKLDSAALSACTSPITYSGLSEGTHTFKVRATDQNGHIDPTAARHTWTVDTTAPTTSFPVNQLLNRWQLKATTGPNPTYSANTQISWTSPDADIDHFQLQMSTNQGASWTTIPVPHPTSTTVRSYIPIGVAVKFRVRGIDTAGHIGVWQVSSGSKLTGRQESNGSVSYTGTWAGPAAVASAYGGYLRFTSVAGRQASTTFTGTQFAWISTLGPNRGKAEVWWGATRLATVDLYAATHQPAAIVFTKTWTTSATRTLVIRVLGQRTAPSISNRVDVDGYLFR